MRTRYLLHIMLFVALLCSCGSKPHVAKPDGFNAEVMLKTTPAKDQGKSNVGWCCAMLDVIETEHLMQGDSVNLSSDYVMRCWLRQQTEDYISSKGSTDISIDGQGYMVCTLIRQDGCFPYDSYYNPQPINYNVVVRRIKMLADLAIAKGTSTEEGMKSIDELLDKEIGFLPKNVYMLRAEYTPLEFAHSVCGKEEYITMTPSEDDDSLLQTISRSLTDRHPVMWTSDANSDNAFAIIGMGRDKDGEQYFVAKDSHGADSNDHGRVYIPASYVRHHTAFIVVKREM